MTVSKATIPHATADGAREDIEDFNKDLIAQAKADGVPESTMVRLRSDDHMERLHEALRNFSLAYQAHDENSAIQYTQPVLFLRRPTSYPVTMDAKSGCLALGKIGGGRAEELGIGHAFVWEAGEKHVFGDVDAVYVGFKVAGKKEG